MAEEILNGSDIGAGFEKMRRKRMTKRVGSDPFGNARLTYGIPDLSRHRVVVKMIAGDLAGSGVLTEGRGREDPLPTPLARGVGKLPGQRFRQVGVASATRQIGEVVLTGSREVLLKSQLQGTGQWHDAMLSAFGVMNGDGALAEIQILHPQAHGLHQAETAAIHDLSDKFPRIFQAGEDRANFLAGHDYRGAARATGGGDGFEGEFLDSKHLPGQENQGVERLLLGGRSDVALQSEEFKIRGDGGWPGEPGRLAERLEAEASEAEHPADISFLRGYGHAVEPDDAAEGINDPVGLNRIGFKFRTFVAQDSGNGAHAEGFPDECPVIGLQDSGLIG